LNHTISYRLIQQAKNNNQTIALEDLTGIRERTNNRPVPRLSAGVVTRGASTSCEPMQKGTIEFSLPLF
jgi:hypothetical protein